MATLPPMGPGAGMGMQMPAGPASTDPSALMEQLVALADDDQQQLVMQQQMQQQELAEAQRQAMIQALQGLIQGLAGGAHVAGGAEAAVPPNEEYAGVAPGMPADALAQIPDPAAGGVMGAGGVGAPVLQPDEIPPEFG